ncbi:hypothetical protein CAPTEDRAFT_213826 [Capitella teleta]|uniref:Desmoplakin SH3 domain-containing protein n=1 Tax=Capitella teleta TaxID=283909 RepID=R7UG67_CAPTE|nr:hypothetical protein CAPTEDRAFT_213826 [Capitella teleta]|eukprot:ELU02287.1 hypothetical protein CAPTEDRAFT_213826 [Capitella teleta]
MRNTLIQSPCGFNMLPISPKGESNGINVKEKCMLVLQQAGATQDFCDFFSDVLQYEYDMNQSIYRLGENLHQTRQDRSPIAPDVLFRTTQEMTKNFNQWKEKVNNLAKRGKDIQPLKINQHTLTKSTVFKAVCSIETKELRVREGEEMTVLDATKPESIKVRTRKGQEGYIPALSCILPTPDRDALTASERLQIQLLASWTECLRKIRTILMDTLLLCSYKLSDEWRDTNSPKISLEARDRISGKFRNIIDATNKQTPRSDVTVLHNNLYSVEQELTILGQNGAGLNGMVDTISNLDKAVLCYQMYRQQWFLYRKSLLEASRPIYVVDTWKQLKSISSGKPFKYYEQKVTYESVETREEVTYVKDTETSSGGCGSTREQVSSDQLTSTSGETQQRIVINGVVDPRTDLVISFQEAVDEGIINQQSGVYRNPKTHETTPIPIAMNEGKIKVEYTTTRKMAEKTTALGLITIKTRKEDTDYTITGLIDPNSGERIDLEEGISRKIIDTAVGEFHIDMTNETMSISNAIESGWIQAKYNTANGEPEYVTKTYAVNSVVDQRLKKKIPFQEAVKRGLIDKDTGNYIHNVTREKVYVTEAIRRGFLKGHVVDDPSSMDIEAENRVVVNKMNILRRNILKPMEALSALRKAAHSKKPEVNGNN